MISMSNKETEQQILRVLDVIRPYLHRDGGDIEFIRFEDGIVYVRMLGACMGCMGLESTLNDGIQTLLIENVPGVIEVRDVEGFLDEE